MDKSTKIVVTICLIIQCLIVINDTSIIDRQKRTIDTQKTIISQQNTLIERQTDLIGHQKNVLTSDVVVLEGATKQMHSDASTIQNLLSLLKASDKS